MHQTCGKTYFVDTWMHLLHNYIDITAVCMFKIDGGVQGFQLKSRDFGQSVHGWIQGGGGGGGVLGVTGPPSPSLPHHHHHHHSTAII